MAGLLFLWCWLVHADAAQAQDLEFSGLVIDQTITKFGHDFYDYFLAEWEPPTDAFTLTINEKPSLIFGTMVSVEVNDTVVYEGLLTPRGIEDKAQDARNYALEFIASQNRTIQELDLY